MNDYEKNIVKLAFDYVKKILGEETTGHDYFHTLRVYRNAHFIAKNYQVNKFVLSLASILHDLDDEKINQNTSYALDFIKKHRLMDGQAVLEIIRGMSYRTQQNGVHMTTIEGKIVQDADRLDALGAIGIARCFAYGGHKQNPIYHGSKEDNSSIAHFYHKLLKLPALMNTKEAKMIANERVNLMKTFLEAFEQEWEGL